MRYSLYSNIYFDLYKKFSALGHSTFRDIVRGGSDLETHAGWSRANNYSHRHIGFSVLPIFASFVFAQFRLG